MKVLLSAVLLFNFLIACKQKTSIQFEKNKDFSIKKVNDSLYNALKINQEYFQDSLLMTKKGFISHYFKFSDSCKIKTYPIKELKENFKGIQIVKNIKNLRKPDTIFVMPPFNYCEQGESYCFFDKSLPKLITDSYCCQPNNLFVVDDIDEDGICEIGICYSTCTSRYKSLKIYSLKQHAWKEIATSTFDILTQNPEEINFSELVKKQNKNKFKICNFENGKTYWETITMN